MIRRTACNRDCPDTCALEVEIDPTTNRAVAIRGVRDDPVTQGFLCERTQRFLSRQYAADRLVEPLLRHEGKLRPVSWSAALDLAASKLNRIRAEYGGAAILNYRSGGSLGILKQIADHFFNAFGPVTAKRGDVCSGAGESAQMRDFGVSESNDLFDLFSSRTILLWGKNPHTSGVHLLPVLREARRRGAFVAGCDPIRTRAVTLCDAFLVPRPGRDFAAALGMARWLFDHDCVDPNAARRCDGLDRFSELVHELDFAGWAKRAGVLPAELERVAQRYGAEGPSAILIGWGLGRRRNGSATVRALDALAAVSGNLWVAGGGASFYFARRMAFDNDLGLVSREPARTLAEPRLGQEILDAKEPPVKAIWVTAGNPVSMLPDSGTVVRALQGLDFRVVVDTHPTDTTDLADLVLPTLTLLEDEDLIGAYGHHFLRASKPVVTPPAGARHEVWIFEELAQRLGLGAEFSGGLDSWKARATRRLRESGITTQALEQDVVRNPFVEPVVFGQGRVARPNGRVDLLGELPEPSFEPTADWPLSLMAVSTPKAQSSQWAIDLPPGPPPVRVHPHAAYGIGDGEVACLETARSSMQVRVVHDAKVHPEIALMEKGGQLRQGRGVNALVRARLTDDGEGAAYYDEPCRLTRSDSKAGVRS